MVGPSGKPLGDMKPALLDEEGRPVPGEMRTVVLYFSDSQAMYLVGEERDVEIPEGVSLEEAIITELMAGPRTHDLWSAIPDDTKLLSVETKNGIYSKLLKRVHRKQPRRHRCRKDGHLLCRKYFTVLRVYRRYSSRSKAKKKHIPILSSTSHSQGMRTSLQNKAFVE